MHTSVVPEDACPTFLDLPEEILLAMLPLVGSPLCPSTAVGLSRCCCKSLSAMPMLRRAARALLAQHRKASALTRKAGLTPSRLRNAGRLSWVNVGISSEETVCLASLIEHMPSGRLEELDLRMNSVGDAGLRALIDCSSHRLLPGLRVLALSSNDISDVGVEALASAVMARRAFVGLEQLRLESNRIGPRGMASLARAINAGALLSLTSCYLSGNPASDGAVQQALHSPSPARLAAGCDGSAYLGGMLGDGQIRCCREARRMGRGLRFF